MNVVWADTTYDGELHPATGAVDGVGTRGSDLGGPSFTYFSGFGLRSGTASAGAPTSAGTYTVLASFAGNGNYNGDTAEKTVTIAKAASTVNVVWADTTFDGSSHPATGSVDGVGTPPADLGSPSFTYYAGSDTSGTALAGAPTNAGTYTVLASFAGNGNYNGDTAEKTVTIAKAASTVNVVWADTTFDGSSHPATGSVDGVGTPPADLGSPSFTYYAGSDTSGTALAGAPTSAGTYTVLASFAGNGNYNGDTAEKTVTIAKAAASVSITWATPQTYNGSAHPATATVNGVGGETDLSPAASLEYFAGSSALTAGTGSATAPTDAGTYTVRATFDGNANYNGDTAVKTIVIEKAAQVITFEALPGKTLGAPAFTVSATGGASGNAVTFSAGPSTACTSGGTNGATITITGVGTCTVTANEAGTSNYAPAAPVARSFAITYRWDGFLQPINDTAHQTGVAQSKFRLGQTIPAKFVIKSALGVVVQQSGNPTFSRSGNLGSCDSTTVLETITEVVTPDSGPTYSWDGNQYHYNWSTKGLTAGEYRIYANLADGTKRYVDICLTK